MAASEPRPDSSPRAVVLLSGGLDSTTAACWALRKGYAVTALSVDYGQRQRIELERARAVAERLGLEHRVLSLDLRAVGGSALTDPGIEVPKDRDEGAIGGGVPVTYVPARNTILLSLALGVAETQRARHLVLGVNALDYSVGGDTRVWVRDERMRVHHPTISEFVDDFPDGAYETLSVDRMTWCPQWRRVRARVAHLVETKRCFRIHLERGSSIDVTEDHSLFTVGDGYELEPIRGAEIEPGMPLVTPLTLEEVHPPHDLESWDLTGLAAFANAGLSRRMAREEAGEVRHRALALPVRLPVTDDLLYAMGLWIAEGHISQSGMICYSNGIERARETVARAFLAFGGSVHVGRNGVDYYVRGGKLFAHMFQFLGLTGRAVDGTKRLPPWFWSLSRPQKQRLLAGFWDGDGGRVHSNSTASCAQKSSALLRDDLVYALQSLGAYPALSPLRSQEGLLLRLCSGHDFGAFAELPLLDQHKASSARRAAARPRRDRSRGLWKTHALWERIRAAPKGPGVAGELYNRLGKYDNSVRGQRHELLRTVGLGHLVDTPLGFQMVTEVEEVEQTVMYDLSVESNENFYANGVLAHNSGYPDCRPEFLTAFEHLASVATRAGSEEGVRFEIHAPLLELTKAEIVKLAIELGAPLELTWSCYDPVVADARALSCGRCDACQLRLKGFREAGAADPIPYASGETA